MLLREISTCSAVSRVRRSAVVLRGHRQAVTWPKRRHWCGSSLSKACLPSAWPTPAHTNLPKKTCLLLCPEQESKVTFKATHHTMTTRYRVECKMFPRPSPCMYSLRTNELTRFVDALKTHRRDQFIGTIEPSLFVHFTLEDGGFGRGSTI